MRRSALLALPLLLLVSACDDYTAPSLYQATTPECKTWTEGSRFELPRGISVYATPPVTLKEGGTELALIFTLPVGTQASFTRLSFLLEEPKQQPFAEAKVLTIYQRGMNQKAEIVDVIEKLPIMFAASATAKKPSGGCACNCRASCRSVSTCPCPTCSSPASATRCARLPTAISPSAALTACAANSTIAPTMCRITPCGLIRPTACAAEPHLPLTAARAAGTLAFSITPQE
ncbi:hypothetical protein [Janthinobacterium sp. MP5059B]|uniref:hypothetical protein n=1 Tax=Janthinobacterium sp. MP5059B TaxID=1766683 RepID=UPI000AAE2C03|nr:hypothetical protein [Janthinobacterium sp. MP5059B]